MKRFGRNSTVPGVLRRSRAHGQSLGQATVELVGTMVIAAVVVAAIWVGGRAGMQVLFDAVSDRQMDFYSAESSEGYSDG